MHSVNCKDHWLLMVINQRVNQRVCHDDIDDDLSDFLLLQLCCVANFSRLSVVLSKNQFLNLF